MKHTVSTLLLVCSAIFILGAGVSVASARTTTPAPPVIVPTWSYLCFEGSTANEVMQKANLAGGQGWELVSAAASNRGAVWCFKQPRWARPEAAQR